MVLGACLALGGWAEWKGAPKEQRTRRGEETVLVGKRHTSDGSEITVSLPATRNPLAMQVMRGVQHSAWRRRPPTMCRGCLLSPAAKCARNYRSSIPANGAAAVGSAATGQVPPPLYMEQQWGEQQTLVAAAPVAAGTEVYRVPRRPEFILRVPDMHSVQISSDEHLDFAKALPAASRTHHACDPNGDLTATPDAVVFVARRDIAQGEFLSFDYNTTEWSMAAPFECRCGSEACVGIVGGFKLLPLERRAAIAPRCSGVVRELATKHGLWPVASGL